MPAARLGQPSHISQPIFAQKRPTQWQPDRRLVRHKFCADRWYKKGQKTVQWTVFQANVPCDLSMRKSSEKGAPNASSHGKAIGSKEHGEGRSEPWPREGGGDGLGKALQPVHNGDQNVLNSTVTQIIHHRQP